MNEPESGLLGGRWTFSRQLGVGFAGVVALTATMALIALLSLRTAVSDYDSVLENEVQALSDAQAIRAEAASRSASVRGFLLSGDARFESAISGWDKAYADSMARLRQRRLTTSGAQAMAAIDAAWRAYQKASDDVLRARTDDRAVAAVAQQFEQRVLPLWDALTVQVKALEEAERVHLADARRDAGEASTRAVALVIGIGVVALLVTVYVGVVLARRLSRQVGSTVQHIRSASAELQVASSQQASGAKEQATAMSEVTTTINELLVTARQIAQSAQRVARIAGDVSSSARVGDTQIRTAQEAVAAIRRQIEALVQHMLDLGRKSQQIGGIVDMITELSEQTNILAINASIEATGAGEAGKRFGVVGEEVRRLADRVGGSTRDIRVLVDEIRSAVNTTVMATEAGSKAVDLAAGRFAELTDGFRRIAEGVVTTTEAAREIELSTHQQTTAVEQVNVAVANVAQATRESESSAAQTLQTASQLASMSSELMRLVQAPSAAG